MKGTVTFVNKNPMPDGNVLHSFRMAGETTYFNCGTFDPDVKKGELIEFDGEVKGPGKFQVNVRSIKVLKEAGPEVATGTSYRKKFVKDEGKEAYWKAREERDVLVQSTIQLQSARNSAIALADVLLKNGIINWEKVKIEKRQERIEDLVTELTERFQTESSKLASPTVEVAVEEPVEAQEATDGDDWS
jgi:hypothetical protein